VNVCEELKLIWIPYRKSGERNLADFFGKHGFQCVNSPNRENFSLISRTNFSNSFKIPEKFKNFDVIISIDNPYRRIINEFKDFSVINWSLKENNRKILAEKFNDWVHPIIFDDLPLISIPDTTHAVLFDYEFETEGNIHYIRTDNLKNDLKFLNDIGSSVQYLKIHLLPDLSDNFKDVFSYENARIIYHLNKSKFETLGYDPFSFTSRNLTLKEKVDFIHW
jgi:hypothetical protein